MPLVGEMSEVVDVSVVCCYCVCDGGVFLRLFVDFSSAIYLLYVDLFFLFEYLVDDS